VRVPLSITVSVSLHAGFAALLWVIPVDVPDDHRAPIELTDRKLPSPPEPLPEPEPPRPPKPAKKTLPIPKAEIPRPVPREPEPEKPPEGQPDSETPAAEDTGAKTFGIQMEGTATAAPGTGVAVPIGGTLKTVPKVRRIGKGDPTGRRHGFKSDYRRGDLAPNSVITAMPRVLSRIRPRYPEEIRDLGIEGQVVLSLRIDDQGKVARALLVRGLHPTLDKEARRAALKMRFSPARAGKTPVTTDITYRFSFVLD
jgi:TonB family protein